MTSFQNPNKPDENWDVSGFWTIFKPSQNSSIDSFATFLFVHFLGEASHQEIRISLKYEESALDPVTSDGYFQFLNFLE